MKRVALIFTSGTLAFGVMVTAFYAVSLFLSIFAMQFQHKAYNITWLK